ncbi:hypothetical protein L7F22_027022 [Adiantum nelumboides]|nr:hypothetical protein [Adiantum nelumboides]
MAAASTSSFAKYYQIEKLNGTNYLPWSLRLQMVLEKSGNLGVVDGTEPNPTNVPAGQAPAAEAKIDAWNKKDLEARTEIILHLGNKQLQLVRQTKTAREMWNLLKQQYQRTNVVSRVLLHKQLNELSMKSFPNTDSFLDAWKKANDDLLIAGLVLPEENQVNILLAALPNDWQSFITTPSNNAALTVNELTALICQEDLLRGNITNNLTTTPMVMAVGERVPELNLHKDLASSSTSQNQSPGLSPTETENVYTLSFEEPIHNYPDPVPAAPCQQPILPLHQPANSLGNAPVHIPTPARDYIFKATRSTAGMNVRRNLQPSSSSQRGLTYVHYPNQRRSSPQMRGRQGATNQGEVSNTNSSLSSSLADSTSVSINATDRQLSTPFVATNETQLSPDNQRYRSISDIMADTTPSQALSVHSTVPHNTHSASISSMHHHSTPMHSGSAHAQQSTDPEQHEQNFPVGDEPSISVDEALASQEAPLWHAAMESKMRSLQQNRTWVLVPRPPDRSIVSCHWILRKKYNADGSIRHKAHLVARGFSQEPGIDFQETFSPTLGLTTFRITMAIGAQYDMEIHQMDVKTAFLNGYLEEDTYMDQPPHFVDSKNSDYVCHLQRSIYGLKQSPRQWNARFTVFMIRAGFQRCVTDVSVYTRHGRDGLLALALYVDDIVLMAPTLQSITSIKDELPES